MKKISFWLACAGMFCAAATTAQAQRTCGTMEYEQQLLQDHNHAQRRQIAEQRTQQWLQQNQGSKQQANVITIPVVVHVVYKTAVQNISDAQVLSQIAVLNEDFRKMNADAGSVPGIFQGLASDTEIAFCLAQRDPNGAPTNGITRTQTHVNEFNGNEVKFSAQGGKDAWNTSQYLNMWVCNLGGGILGYAQFPGGPANTDGVVLGYSFFGREGMLTAPYNKGRTATHEVGHWLNLRHIWGDANCGNDFVSDTPTQQGPNYDCPSFPRPSCGNQSDMFMNYMDYVDDACMYMFTHGQKSRMLAALNTERAGLLSSAGCVPPNASANDAGISAILSPGPHSCTLTFSPVVTLKNFGTNPLTSVTINYTLNGNSTAVYNWTGHLAAQASQNVVLPSINASTGSNTFTASTSNPNHGTDGNPANDAQTSNFIASDYSAAMPLPFSESFEGSSLPANWQIENPDNAITWEPINRAAKTGSKAMWINNYAYDAHGEPDFLLLPPVDLTSLLSPVLSFELAYKLYTPPFSFPNYSDTLQVWVTTDCGTSWQMVYNKSGYSLTTGTAPVYFSGDYTPAPGDWRQESISLQHISNSNYAVFAFRNATSFENNLYIDDVNISGISAVSESAKSEPEVQLFPNPTTGQFQIKVSNQNAGPMQIFIFDQMGRQVHATIKLPSGDQQISIDLSEMPAGIYFARIQTPNSLVTRKVVLTR